MNPTTKPTDTRLRVYRGGSWYGHAPSWVRAASRDTLGPAYRNINLGFRCALRAREPR
jgi:formylglycine-generating enzyme required for sulfatase activity